MKKNLKLSSQVDDQERFFTKNIDILVKENINLEVTLQRFTQQNKILNQMIHHSKISLNHEWLGYDKTSPPKMVAHTPNEQRYASPNPPSQMCSYYNKNGHAFLNCKYKNSETVKGKFI